MAAPKCNEFSVGHGRPKKEIDWHLFEELCSLQCTQEEMAGVLKVHKNTLSDQVKEHYNEDDYSTAYNKLSAGGKTSLRRYQFNLSKKSASMAIFLGKNWLAQKDNQEIAVSPETAKEFGSIMNQMATLQEERKRLRDQSQS